MEDNKTDSTEKLIKRIKDTSSAAYPRAQRAAVYNSTHRER